jgi:hypothetical protein
LSACIHTLEDVGEWPKTLAIKRISRIVVYSGDVIDSLRITYELTSGTAKTMQHGGDGGGMFLDLPIAGNLYFICGVQKLLTPSELQQTKNSSLFMVASSRMNVSSAQESMCPRLLTSLPSR